MPYIITTTNPREIARIQGYYDREPRRFGKVGTWDEPLERVKAGTSRAVATLDDAKGEIREIIAPIDSEESWRFLFDPFPANIDLTRRIGPLKDGTVIEIEHCRWDDLRDYLRGHGIGFVSEPGDGGSSVIDAYNEAQEN